ncbi:MAG: maleylpyruvate isomerase family mycothiol-dependent enzyme [Acidimicrobiia bacterium]
MSTLSDPLALPVEEYLDAVRSDGRVLIESAADAGMDAPVPTCPDWTVLDLVHHVESVYRHKTASVRDDHRDGSPPWVDVDDGADLGSLGGALSEMISVFERADLSLPSWTWCPHDHRADWWVRRMAHETTIHAADALAAAGRSHEIPQMLAVDGVDEILDEMLIGAPRWATLTPADGRIDLRSDGRTWSVRLATMVGTSPRTGIHYDEDALILEPDTQPDTVINADPSTLDLWLWGRATLPPSCVSGNGELVDRLRSIAASATV